MSVYNGERFLREAVDSILSQTYTDLEFIIIDDGSSDGTPSILAEYERRDPRVRVYRQENRGAAPSWNRGCELAQGKYIARMDADDISLPDRLRRQVKFMEEHSEIGLLGGEATYIDAQGESVRLGWRIPREHHEIKALLPLKNCIYHPSVMMRKEEFLSVGGYREVFADCADYDLWLRMAQRCRVANLSDPVLKYRIHSEQVSSRKVRQQKMRGLAAQALLSPTEPGGQALLDSVKEITPDVLFALGVTEACLQRELAEAYLSCVGGLLRTSGESAALGVAEEMLRSSRWQYADSRVIAEMWLTAAAIYWKQKRIFRSFLAVGRALRRRPIVAGRPFRRWLQALAGKAPGLEKRELGNGAR